MKRLLKFRDFFKVDESFESEEIDRAKHLFESDLLQQKFIIDVFGEDPDYELDRDTIMTSTGLDYEVWIEIKNAPQEVLDKCNSQKYEEDEVFVKPFVDWAEKHQLYDPEVTTPDNNEENSIIFKVNAGPVDDEDQDEEE